jgi:hypothetical protein
MQSFNLKSGVLNQLDFRRVWIFTNDDNPNGSDLTEQARVIQVAKDGAETGVEISLWCMDKSNDKAFSSSLFYDKLLVVGIDSDLDNGETDSSIIAAKKQSAGFDSFDTMIAQVRRKEFKKRRLCTITLLLPDSDWGALSRRITVGFYKTIMAAKRPQYQWLQVCGYMLLTSSCSVTVS